MRQRLTFFAASIALLAAAAPGAAAGPRFKLTLPYPMRAEGVRLEPGTYEVTFEPAPQGPPHYVAVFSQGGKRIATAPALLKNAPPGFKLSDYSLSDWIQASWNQNYARKDGLHLLRGWIGEQSELPFEPSDHTHVPDRAAVEA